MNYMSIGLIFLGILVIYLSAVIRYVKPPFEWVIESNLPWEKETQKQVWKGGLHFLWFPIPPFMYVRNKIYCGDVKKILTIGVADKNPGNPSLVEFSDTSASVIAQVILRVTDPIKATYEIEAGEYESAALERIEGNFRKILSGMTLDVAMSNVDARSEISKKAFQEVNKAIKKWGVAIVNANKEIPIIDFIVQDSDLLERAKILKAEKDYKVTIKTAEATKQRTVLERSGEGEGEAIKVSLLAEKLGIENAQAADYLLRKDMIEAVKSSTLIATSEGGNLNTPVGLAQTMFAIDSARKSGSKEGGQ